MSSQAPHLYRFAVNNPAPSSNSPDAAVAAIHVIATSPAAAEAAITDQLPHVGTVILAGIDRYGDGCTDERCAVCFPSSRNARLL